MDRLTGLDASFLYFESRTQMMHVCGLLIIDTGTMPEPYSFETLRNTLRQRLGSNPAFRRKLHNPLLNLDHPVWVDDEDFDIEHHVRRATVAAPGGREQLADVCADIAGQPMDRSRPLWEFWAIDGLPDGKLAVMTKMHHATVDGVSGASLISELCSISPGGEPLASGNRTPAPKRPRDRDIVLDGLRHMAVRPVKLARLVSATIPVLPVWVRRSRSGTAMPAPFTAPRTSFNGTITSHRAVSWAQMDLADVKEIKNAFGTTVNDVVLALCAGALRSYLEDRGELPGSPLLASVPVSVHGKVDGPGANKVSSMFASIRTDISDPAARLEAIAAQGRVSKEHHKTISASMLQDWAHFSMPNTFGIAVRVYSRLRLADRHPPVHNLVISNVPGPPMPIYFAGARIVGFYPLGPVFHGAGLNMTVVSNDGHLDVGIIACRELAPDVWDLADGMTVALDELLTAARARQSATPPTHKQQAMQA